MDFWTPHHIQSVIGGRWLHEPAVGGPHVQGVSIDSRTLKPGELFVAVRGEQHDGHDHINAAIEKGAAMVLVEKEPTDLKAQISNLKFENPAFKCAILLVPDTVRALQELAAAWRTELDKHHVKIVAVTGSNGKTTTRHMIHAALSANLTGTQSPKSFNNHLGVPLTLLAASTDDDFVVAEVGTNHPGEIAALAAILRPHVAVITNIGTAHIGMFGGKDAIAAEKSTLFRFIEPGGCAVINGAQPYESVWRAEVVPTGVHVTTFGRVAGSDVRIAGAATADDRGLHFNLDGGQPVHLPLLGQHNIDNALAAFAVSRFFGIDDAAAARSLGAATGVERRMQITRIGPRESDGSTGRSDCLTIINDAYNANPDSMLSALSTLAALPLPSARGRRIAVLGDMLELGDEAPYEHQHVGDMLCVFNQLAPKPPGAPVDPVLRAGTRLTKIHLAILIGPLMAHAAAQLARVWPQDSFIHIDQWSAAVPAQVAALLRADDIVLLKASRGLRFERLLPEMEKSFGAAVNEKRTAGAAR